MGRKGERGSAPTLSNPHTHRLTLPPYPSLQPCREERTWGRGLPVQREAGRQADRQIVCRGRTDWAKGRRGKNSRETRRR